MSDAFTVPREMRPDVMIDAEPYFDKWCYGLPTQVQASRVARRTLMGSAMAVIGNADLV